VGHGGERGGDGHWQVGHRQAQEILNQFRFSLTNFYKHRNDPLAKKIVTVIRKI
jgi:hypothetical protein